MRTQIWSGICLIAISIALVGDATAQEFDDETVVRVERAELGTFDDKPLFQRFLWAKHDSKTHVRMEVLRVEDAAAFRDLPSQQKRTSDKLDLAQSVTVLFADERLAGPYEALGSTELNAKQNLITTHDWPPLDPSVAPYPYKRTRRLLWDRKKKKFAIAEREVFVPKIERMARLERATEKKQWKVAWRAALALDPFDAGDGDAPACDPIVGHLTLDLLIAHLDELLADGDADDAHRVLSLAFKFGGPRAAACGITTSGVESGRPAAFVGGANFELPKTCGHTKYVGDQSPRCQKSTSFGRKWSNPERTSAALRSFAEFAAARGDHELMQRIVSGLVERRFHDDAPPGEYKAGSWANAWKWFADDMSEAGLKNLATAAYWVAQRAEGGDTDFSKKVLADVKKRGLGFEEQTVPDDLMKTVKKLLADGKLLMAIGEVERYEASAIRGAGLKTADLQDSVVDAMDAAIGRAKKKKRETELSDLRALRGKARWLNPLSR